MYVEGPFLKAVVTIAPPLCSFACNSPGTEEAEQLQRAPLSLRRVWRGDAEAFCRAQ